MREIEVAHRIRMSHVLQPCIGGYTVVWVGWEMIIGVIVHDKRPNLRQKGACD